MQLPINVDENLAIIANQHIHHNQPPIDVDQFMRENKFVPTPSMPTPPLVHMEPTMPTSSPTPHEEVVQIEHISTEDIELMVGLQRSRCPPAHAPNCGTGDGMYFVYTPHLLKLLILCIWLNMLI